MFHAVVNFARLLHVQGKTILIKVYLCEHFLAMSTENNTHEVLVKMPEYFFFWLIIDHFFVRLGDDDS